jgi:hypothetical protein
MSTARNDVSQHGATSATLIRYPRTALRSISCTPIACPLATSRDLLRRLTRREGAIAVDQHFTRECAESETAGCRTRRRPLHHDTDQSICAPAILTRSARDRRFGARLLNLWYSVVVAGGIVCWVADPGGMVGVVVLGAGPVGLATAMVLVDQGYEVTVSSVTRSRVLTCRRPRGTAGNGMASLSSGRRITCIRGRAAAASVSLSGGGDCDGRGRRGRV